MKIAGITPLLLSFNTVNKIKNQNNFINFKSNESDTFALNQDNVPEKRVQRIQKQGQKAVVNSEMIKDKKDEILKGASDVEKKAKYELKRVQKKVEIIKGLIERGKEGNFEPFEYETNRVEFRNDGKPYSSRMFLDEYDQQSGKLIRSTEFDSYNKLPMAIEEYSKKEGTNRYELSHFDNYVIKIIKASSKKGDVTLNRKEYSYGCDGSVKRYVKNRQFDSKGNEKKAEHWYFAKDELNYFSKDQIDNADGSSEIGLEFNFSNGKLVSYKENIKYDSSRTLCSSDTYEFDDENNFIQHTKIQPNSDGTRYKEYYYFENGELYRYSNPNSVIDF